MIKVAGIPWRDAGAAAWPPALPLRCLTLGGSAAAAAAVLLLVEPGSGSDPALSHLLRGMAVIKFLLAALAAAALVWRFGRPVPRHYVPLLLAGCWSMSAAAALVWQLAHIGAGALWFHAGELSLLIALWREHRASLGPQGPA
jgi:hypothetical protein